MARTAPIILVFILNCSEIFIFRNLFSVSFAPRATYIGKDIFSIGMYFLLLSLKLYPRSFRRSHWIGRSFTEFILGVYLLETFLCDFWFPLEYFAHCTLQKLILIIRYKTPKSGPLCLIMCNLVQFLSKQHVPLTLSIVLSSFMTLIIIHGTRTLNFGLIWRCGIVDFLLHFKDRVMHGVLNLIKSFTGRKSCGDRISPCSRPHTNCSGPLSM